MNRSQKALDFRLMDEASARAIVRWQYEPPYDLYNMDPGNVKEAVEALLDPRNHYFSMADEQGKMVAYCCFGPDAQVQGGDYGGSALDIGLGVRPDLTGKGQGLYYVEAVLDFARATFSATALRATVAAFNRRARRVWEKAGFRQVQTFQRSLDGREFVILTRAR
jgi:ribosomal-protein-alanine N-acetyltransferase